VLPFFFLRRACSLLCTHSTSLSFNEDVHSSNQQQHHQLGREVYIYIYIRSGCSRAMHGRDVGGRSTCICCRIISLYVYIYIYVSVQFGVFFAAIVSVILCHRDPCIYTRFIYVYRFHTQNPDPAFHQRRRQTPRDLWHAVQRLHRTTRTVTYIYIETCTYVYIYTYIAAWLGDSSQWFLAWTPAVLSAVRARSQKYTCIYIYTHLAHGLLSQANFLSAVSARYTVTKARRCSLHACVIQCTHLYIYIYKYTVTRLLICSHHVDCVYTHRSPLFSRHAYTYIS
jgi:hypothetical protein